MPEHNLIFGGGTPDTLLHPIVLAAMMVAVVLILVLPRKYAIVPFLIVIFLTPLAQNIYVGGLHLFVLRILILTGWVRIVSTMLFSRTPIFVDGSNLFDKMFIVWTFWGVSAVLFLYWQQGAIVSQLGVIWDVAGGYFLLRFLVQDEDDVYRVIKVFAGVAAIVAVCMANEKLRGQNLFGFLGGVPIISAVREGSIRAQGPFEHAILAGTFGATLLCLFLLLWISGGSKFFAVLGLLGATVITITSASSTPLMAYLSGVLVFVLWPLRKKMKSIRWGLAGTLIALQLVMKAPVWFLIARVDLVAGNSGYHRAMLIDTFIRHFGDWWLFGTKSNYSWGYDMGDLANQFVAEGEMGGLLKLICFIVMLSWCFSRLGAARKAVEGDRKREWFFWLLGGALFSHIVAFFGIGYFDQMKMSFYALFVFISAATAPLLVANSSSAENEKVLPLSNRRLYPSPSVSGSTGRVLN